MLAFETDTRKSFNSNFVAKIQFRIRHFMLPFNTNADMGSLKFLHTLFDVFGPLAGEI